MPDLAPATEEDYAAEFLALKISVKVVSGVEEAISHSTGTALHHSDAIVTEDAAAAEKFLNEVDSAAVYVNASTRFTDGFEFGLGAEMGISTQKLHARGRGAARAYLLQISDPRRRADPQAEKFFPPPA